MCESLRIVMLSLGSIDMALILQFFQAMETSRIDQYLLWRFVYITTDEGWVVEVTMYTILMNRLA